ERDQPLRERAELLCLGRGRRDPPMTEQARRHVPQQRLAVARRTAELPALLTMSHLPLLLSLPSGRIVAVGGFGKLPVVLGILRPPQRPVLTLGQPHAEAEALLRQKLTDLLQRLLAEVIDRQH